jgi:hypothetical protein
MNIPELAKRLAVEHRLPRAERYNLWLREFDNMVELVGLVPDPNYDMKDFIGKEMLFPKRWVTLGVFDAEMKV